MRYFTTEWQQHGSLRKMRKNEKNWMKRLLEIAKNTKNNLIIEYKADFLNSDIEFMKWREQFDVWMYDEFLPIDSEAIQHDISFLSGSELVIACKKVSIEKI